MPFPATGGSVLVCWKFDDGPHGYVRQFDVGEAVITQQLQQMYAAGQRRLAVLIPFFPGGNTFALDSTNGCLATQDAANLQALFSLIKQLNFAHVMIRMLPEWTADPGGWQGVWQPQRYAENWLFTLKCWKALTATGFDPGQCAIDLGAETLTPLLTATDPKEQALILRYHQQLWGDWCDQQSTVSGTVGFSVTENPAWVQQFKRIYSNGQSPSVFAWDIYHPETQLAPIQEACSAAGYWQGMIVTETYTNDLTGASAFKNKPGIFWLYQWGVGRDTPLGVTQDRLTVDYSNYANAGL